MRVFRTLLRLRFIMVAIVPATAAGSVLMMIQGSWKIVEAYHAFWNEPTSRNTVGYVVDGLDSFLIAMVLMLFGTGVFKMFSSEKDLDDRDILSGIAAMKNTLAEVVLVVLFVEFLGTVIVTREMNFEMLVIPVGVLCLAFALRLMGLKSK